MTKANACAKINQSLRTTSARRDLIRFLRSVKTGPGIGSRCRICGTMGVPRMFFYFSFAAGDVILRGG